MPISACLLTYLLAVIMGVALVVTFWFKLKETAEKERFYRLWERERNQNFLRKQVLQNLGKDIDWEDEGFERRDKDDKKGTGGGNQTPLA